VGLFSYMLLNLFLLNVWPKLTLRHLTIFASSESSFFTLVHFSSGGSIFKHEYLTHKRPSLVLPFTHLSETCLPETFVRKTFNRGIKLYSYEPITTTNHIDSDTTCWKNPNEKNIENIKQKWDKNQIHTQETDTIFKSKP